MINRTLTISGIDFKMEVVFPESANYGIIKLENEFFKSEELIWFYLFENLTDRINEDKEEILKEYHENKFINKYYWLY